MKTGDDFFEKIGTTIASNPSYIGLILGIIGVLILFAAIYDVDMIFGKKGGVLMSANIKKTEGQVYFFGRKTVRFFVGTKGIILILIGAFLVYSTYL